MSTVQTKLLPFKTTFKTETIEEGLTLREIYSRFVPVPINGSSIILTVNNQVVPEELWDSLRTSENMIIGINAIPTGGGSGRKITATIISVIMTIGAVYTGGLAYAAGWTVEGVLYGVTAVGLAVTNQLVYNAIYQTPIKSNLNSRSVKDSTTQFISGASNDIDPFGVIPVNLGTNRMFPKQAALPYTEANGKDNYVRQLFTYGYGNVFLDERKIGETLLEKYNDLQVADRLNGDLNKGTNLYTDDVYQENFQLKLSYEVGWIERRSQIDTEQMVIDIIFNRGLFSYDNNGNKINRTVTFAIETKKAEEEWTDSTTYEMPVGQQSIGWCGGMSHFAKYNNTLGLEISTGRLAWFNRSVPSGWLQIGHLQARGEKMTEYVDDRAVLIGKDILNADDFAPVSGTDVWKHNCVNLVLKAGTIIKNTATTFIVTNAMSEAFTVTKTFNFPEPGLYDVRIRRNTPDSDDDKIVDEAYLSAIKSIKHQEPVKQADISGTAMYIKATDQLNGSIDKYNAIVTTIMPHCYDGETGLWYANGTSSNPADIFRYVLQSKAFAKRLPDSRINIEKLEEWWIYCDENDLTYNRIIDYEASIDEVLNDICAAGFATISKADGIYSVIIDNERPVISGLITPRNSWNYKGSLVYPDLPHALRIQFRNKDKGYETDERIVYDDGYNESNAELYERIEFLSCTNADLAYKYGKRYFATAKLQPETHSFEMDFENLTFNRGDRIVLVNDAILVGVGQGRIKELIVDDASNPTVIEGFVIDDTVTIPDNNNFAVRIRYANGTGFGYYLLRSFVGTSDTFYFSTSVEYNENIAVDSLVAFVEDGKELDLIVSEIVPSSDRTATITCVNYAPERFDPIGTIPPFESNVTIPADFFAPFPPELNGNIQSDKSVMIKSSDGSYISTMIIPLLNRNEPSVIPVIQYRPVGATEWSIPHYLKRDPSQIVLTDLKDGFHYDFRIRYQRATGLQSLSEPLELNSILFVGTSGIPADVKGFKVTLNSATGLFEWFPNEEVDISHYVIRYTRGDENEEITWESSSVVADNIEGNRVSLPIRAGYFLIKAVDLGGRESENPAVIQSIDEGAFNNIVEDLTQQPDWLGVKDEFFILNGVLTGTGKIGEKYYYFNPDVIDLGGVYDCVFASELVANLVMSNFVREWEDVRERQDVRETSPKIRPYESIRSVNSIRGFSDIDWGVEIQSNLSLDGENWTGWQRLVASNQQFRYAKLRLYAYTQSEIATPAVKKAAVYIDLPDRRESQEDVYIDDPENGKTITYKGAFKNNPSVNITIQDGAVDDKLEYVNKDREGFTVRVFNATLNGYVSRTFDYLAAGYGREL